MPCAHPLLKKSVACIRQNGLSGCAHPYPKRPFRTSVPEMTRACIRFQVTEDQHLDPIILNFGFNFWVFTKEDGPDH